MGLYHKEASALLVIDEFQDISEVDEAEALFRNALQHLPADFSVSGKEPVFYQLPGPTEN